MKAETRSRAYGRVNLIGEHTDYNHGWVLPTAIPQYTEIFLSRSAGRTVHLESSGERVFSFELGTESPLGTWVDYLQGATLLLQESGKKLTGFHARITSTIPEGSGVSSSAALEMSFLKGLNDLFELSLTPISMAKLGQQIENDFVGARVGIMDQMATCLCQAGEALYLDTETLSYERIPLPLSDMDLLVLNSGITHRLSASDGGYNERRAQCEKAAELLGISSLREATLEMLEASSLPTVLLKRARHVVTENARVKAAVAALKARNLPELGRLFKASHLSLRDDYQVSLPEIDLLVSLCEADSRVFGARLTGGGFGGSIVLVCEKGSGDHLAPTILMRYEQVTGEIGTRLV